MKRVLIFAILLIWLPPALAAQAPASVCSLDPDAITKVFDNFLDGKVKDYIKLNYPDPAGEADNAIVNEPVKNPESKHIDAAAASGIGSGLVDGADFPTLLGFALNNNIIDSDDNGITFNLNLFAVKSTLDPLVLERQSEYEKYRNLRRFAGSLTFGGQSMMAGGSSMSGSPTSLPDPSELDDVIRLDLKIRLSGSRDRRDPENYSKIFDSTQPQFEQLADATALLLGKFVQGYITSAEPDCDKRAQQVFGSLSSEVDSAVSASAIFKNKRDAVFKEVDGRALWTLVVASTNRQMKFGADEQMIGLRGAFGGNNRNYTFNLDFTEIQGLMGAKDTRKTKLAFEYATSLWQEKFGRDGARGSLSIGYEKFKNVPNMADDTIAKLNAKLVFPVSKTVDIPVSFTWANKTDLLVGENEIRGHIGFTLNFDKFAESLVKGQSN